MTNTPLPVEYGPTTEDDAVLRPSDHTSGSLAPLLVSHPVSQDGPSPLGLSSLGLGAAPLPPQPAKPRLLLQRTQPIHHEVTSCCEALEPSWAEPVPAPGHWLHPEPPHHKPCSRNSSSSGSQRLKNKTKNLWNPTYGSWVLENFRGKKTLAHTQSMPLSTSTSSTASAQVPQTSDCNDGMCDLNPAGLCTSSSPSPSFQGQSAPSGSSHKTGPSGAKAGMDLAKLQSFPCGNVNYAYDEQSYETESLPLVKAKGPDAITNTSSAPSVSSGLGLALGFHASSSAVPKLLLKRHASYGHEDVRRHTKADKPTRDRDSGFSLSEDLSVTPV